MRRSGLFAVAVALVACGGGTGAAPSPAPPIAGSPTSIALPVLWRSTAAPSGAPSGSEWVAIDAFDGKTLVASVQRGSAATSLPVLVMLHPDGGLRTQFLQLSANLAKAGFVTITPCWAQGGDASDPPIACSSGAPSRTSAADLTKDVMSIADAARTLPGARPDRLALVGHSGGAQAAFIVGSMTTNIEAVVAMSAGYGPNIRQRWGTTLPDQLDAMHVPFLIVHGVADRQGPGTAIDLVRAFEKTAREKGKTVEAIYVDGAPHGFPYATEYWTADLQAQVVAFLQKHLK